MCDDNDDNNRQTTAYVKQTLTGLLKNLPAPTVMGQENPGLGKKMYPQRISLLLYPHAGVFLINLLYQKYLPPTYSKWLIPFSKS